MQNTPFIEKRIFPRFKISIPLSFLDLKSDKLLTQQTHDISTQGLCIVANQEFPLGANLDMRIQMIDNNEKIYVKGNVVWYRMIDSGKYRIGIKLEDSKLKPIPLVLRTIMAKREY